MKISTCCETLKRFWRAIWNDGRNFLEILTDKTKVNVEWAKYLFNVRMGFVSSRTGKWTWISFSSWRTVTQNFWNGVFTINLYLVKTKYLILPRINLVVRFHRNYWFQFGLGWLFDRGTFAFKLVISNWGTEEKYNPGVNAIGWNEGPV